MLKQLMLTRAVNWKSKGGEDFSEVVFRINCGCEHIPDHEWTFTVERDKRDDMPSYLTYRIESNNHTCYSGLWRRLQYAWRLVRHKEFLATSDMFVHGDQVAAFEEAIRWSKEFLSKPQ